MAIFLSDEWVGLVDEALRAIPAPTTPMTAGTVEYRVGDRAYHLTLGADGVHARCGPAPCPTVVFVQSRATAAEIGRGERSGQGAVQAGDVVVHGDPTILLSWRLALVEADAALSHLATFTSY